MLYNYLNKAVRADLIPTTSYVVGTQLDDCHNFNQLDILVKWTAGTASSMEIYAEYSVDGTTFFRDCNATVTSGSTALVASNYTFVDGGNYRIEIPISCRYVNIYVKGSGTLTTSKIQVDAVLHIV